MRGEKTIYKIITRLFDKYPNLTKDDKKLTWCVWTELGFTDSYNMTFKNFLSAPSVTSISRVRRQVFEDHPPYKES
ncbi:MAG: hypothetical protein DRN30_06295 [Thermoplasmata archaeon]|nr:MAG: hypothetical protein DRN30_06295 [Thermoplasmata archaeon]